MMDKANMNLKRRFLPVIVYWIFLFFFSCSPMDAGIRKDNLDAMSLDKRGNSIMNLSVSAGTTGTMVTIEAEGPLFFTQFREVEPDRLVLDVTGGLWGKLEGPIDIMTGPIRRIVNTQIASPNTPIARMEVFVERKVQCELFPKYKKLTLLFSQKEKFPTSQNDDLAQVMDISERDKIPSKKASEFIKEEAKTPGPPAAEKITSISNSLRDYLNLEEKGNVINPGAKEEDLKVQGEKESKAEDKKAETFSKKEDKTLMMEGENVKGNETFLSTGKIKPSPASCIFDFSIKRGDGKTQFVIIGDGEFKNVDSFRLMKPDRIVVDIWDVQRSFRKKEFSGDGIHFKKVRFGDHRDKVRVVFDLNEKESVPFAIAREGNNLVVSMGKDIKTDEIKSSTKTGVINRGEMGELKKVQVKGSSTGYASKARSFLSDHEVLDTSRKMDTKTIRVSLSQDGERIKDAHSSFQWKGKPLLEIPPSATAQSEQIPSQLSFPKIHTGLEAGKIYTGRRIDLDFQDIDIHNIFRLLAEISNLNIIVDEKVKGRITMRLMDIPWDQALDIILQTKDLGMIMEGNVLMIAPLKELRQKESEIQRAIQAKEKAIAEAEMAKQEAAIKARERQAELEPLITETIFVNYSKAKDVERQFKPYLSKRGTILMDERTNSLTVTDVKGTIQTIKSLLERLDTPTPQVMIEARIVQADRSFGRSLGIQWGAQGLWNNPRENRDIFAAYSGYTTNYQPSTPPTDAYSRWDNLSASQFAVNFPASVLTGLTPAAMGFKFGRIVGDIFSLDLKLSMAEAEGLTRIVSRPKITTLDNIKATIKSGESIPYETVSEQGTQTTFVDAVLELTVTPHVTPDGKVKMDIKATKNAIGTFRSATGAPSITKRETETQVLVSNGETTVIGGIFEQTKETTLQAVPWFSKIPILGWLFKGKTWQDKNNELLIFITPFIIKEVPERSAIS